MIVLGRTRDRHRTVWDWSIALYAGWWTLRHPVEVTKCLDGGSRHWRLGPVEIQRNIRHDLR